MVNNAYRRHDAFPTFQAVIYMFLYIYIGIHEVMINDASIGAWTLQIILQENLQATRLRNRLSISNGKIA